MVSKEVLDSHDSVVTTHQSDWLLAAAADKKNKKNKKPVIDEEDEDEHDDDDTTTARVRFSSTSSSSRQRGGENLTSSSNQEEKTNTALVSSSSSPVKISTTCSLGTVETDISESDLDVSRDNALLSSHGLVRKLRWSDEAGHDLVKTHVLDRQLEHTVRVIVLLMNDQVKRFEFIHCEYQTDDKIFVSDALEQFPHLASCIVFRNTRFVALIREEPPHNELVNIFTLQDYDLGDGEILIATNHGSHPTKECLKQAQKLLKSHHKMLRKAAKRARIQGRALRFLQSSEAWAASRSAVPEERGRKKELKGLKKRGSESEDEFKGGFLPASVLREHRRLSDEAAKKNSSSSSSSSSSKKSSSKRHRHHKKHKKTPYIEFITWIRTKDLRAKMQRLADKAKNQNDATGAGTHHHHFHGDKLLHLEGIIRGQLRGESPAEVQSSSSSRTKDKRSSSKSKKNTSGSTTTTTTSGTTNPSSKAVAPTDGSRHGKKKNKSRSEQSSSSVAVPQVDSVGTEKSSGPSQRPIEEPSVVKAVREASTPGKATADKDSVVSADSTSRRQDPIKSTADSPSKNVVELAPERIDPVTSDKVLIRGEVSLSGEVRLFEGQQELPLEHTAPVSKVVKEGKLPGINMPADSSALLADEQVPSQALHVERNSAVAPLLPLHFNGADRAVSLDRHSPLRKHRSEVDRSSIPVDSAQDKSQQQLPKKSELHLVSPEKEAESCASNQDEAENATGEGSINGLRTTTTTRLLANIPRTPVSKELVKPPVCSKLVSKLKKTKRRLERERVLRELARVDEEIRRLKSMNEGKQDVEDAENSVPQDNQDSMKDLVCAPSSSLSPSEGEFSEVQSVKEAVDPIIDVEKTLPTAREELPPAVLAAEESLSCYMSSEDKGLSLGGTRQCALNANDVNGLQAKSAQNEKLKVVSSGDLSHKKMLCYDEHDDANTQEGVKGEPSLRHAICDTAVNLPAVINTTYLRNQRVSRTPISLLNKTTPQHESTAKYPRENKLTSDIILPLSVKERTLTFERDHSAVASSHILNTGGGSVLHDTLSCRASTMNDENVRQTRHTTKETGAHARCITCESDDTSDNMDLESFLRNGPVEIQMSPTSDSEASSEQPLVDHRAGNDLSQSGNFSLRHFLLDDCAWLSPQRQTVSTIMRNGVVVSLAVLASALLASQGQGANWSFED